MGSLLELFALLVIPSAIGAGSYLVCRKLRPTARQVLVATCFYLLFCLLFDALGQAVFLLIVGAAISKLGGWGHGKSIEGVESGWESPHLLVFLATLFSLFAGSAAGMRVIPLATTICYLVPIAPQYLIWLWFAFVALYSLALLLSPSMMPFLIWGRQSMRLRPGMDKDFDE